MWPIFVGSFFLGGDGKAECLPRKKAAFIFKTQVKKGAWEISATPYPLPDMSTVKHLPKNQQNCRLKRLWLKRGENQKRSPPLWPNRWFAHLRNHPRVPYEARTSNCSSHVVLTLVVKLSGWQQWDYPKRKGFWHSFWLHTVDGRNPLIGTLSHYLQGFIHPGWLAGFLPSTVWLTHIRHLWRLWFHVLANVRNLWISDNISHHPSSSFCHNKRSWSYGIIIRPNQTLRHYALSLSFLLNHHWLVVSTHLKNISQKWESSPNRGENKRYLSCHHLDQQKPLSSSKNMSASDPPVPPVPPIRKPGEAGARTNKNHGVDPEAQALLFKVIIIIIIIISRIHLSMALACQSSYKRHEKLPKWSSMDSLWSEVFYHFQHLNQVNLGNIKQKHT